jgi:Helicase conserved C-terminal domain
MDIRKLFDGKISYFAGAPDYTYPEVHMKIRKCKMSRHQTQWYRATVEAEMKATGDVRLREISDSFYIKSRQRSNIVYPLGLTGQSGLDALTPAMIRDNLEVYSTKYATLIKKLARGGLSFIYTGFTGAGGIAALVKCLLAVGYVDYYDQYDSKGHKRKGRRFVIWSGEQTAREKDEIRAVFNSSENDNGSQIQIVIGSPAIKEGVSLLRVRSVHLIEPYWNKSRIEQIFGRAVRYCSHKSLPRDERSVTIYIYVAIATGPEEKKSPLISIDNYMLDCAARKTKEMEPYISQMIDIAVDRGLW